MRHRRSLDRYKEHRDGLLFLLSKTCASWIIIASPSNGKVLGQWSQNGLEQGRIGWCCNAEWKLASLQGELRHPAFRTFCTMTSPELLLLPTPFHQLSSLLEAQPGSFISGNKEIQDAALRATEHVFNIGSRYLQPRNPTLTSPV
jgi:hypothetical protein